jgi:hypothetical protein
MLGTKKMLAAVAVVAMAFVFVPATGRSATPGNKWLDAPPNSSCEDVCTKGGLHALSSGTFTDGNKFFVCAEDHGGWRPGWNRRPENDCRVADGGKEVIVKEKYRCLCEAP